MAGIDFDAQIEALFEGHTATKGDLSIWGGEFDADDTPGFLEAWKLEKRDMPWRLWEWVSDITLEHDPTAMPKDVQWLERVRLFGDGGDLALRRDGNRMRWRYVGPGEATMPQGFLHNDDDYDYWQHDDHGDRQLLCRERTVLLWGQERRGEDKSPLRTWQEDRASSIKKLIYPDMSGKSSHGRAQLRYREYLYGDNIEAVWWLRLEGWEVDNG